MDLEFPHEVGAHVPRIVSQVVVPEPELQLQLQLLEFPHEVGTHVPKIVSQVIMPEPELQLQLQLHMQLSCIWIWSFRLRLEPISAQLSLKYLCQGQN